MQNSGTHLIFDFIDINPGPDRKMPAIRIEVNGGVCYDGPVQSRISVAAELENENLVKIYFVNKSSTDTQVDSAGKIVQDMNFTLANISAENTTFDELLWNGRYVAGIDVYDSCLFFGPYGFYELCFQSPVLKHKLQQKFERGELDAHWEEDYNYYTEACKILKKLSIS